MTESVHVLVDSNDDAMTDGTLTSLLASHPDVEQTQVFDVANADLVIGNAGFERKTPSDFAASIMKDGRDIFDQCQRMAAEYPRAYVLLEGDLGDFERLEHTNLPPQACRGTMASLDANTGVPTIACGDRETLVDVAVRYGRKTIEETSRHNVVGSPAAADAPAAVRAFCCIEGVGPERAWNLYEAGYSSIAAALEASRTDLQQVEGFGEQTATSFFEGLRGIE